MKIQGGEIFILQNITSQNFYISNEFKKMLDSMIDFEDIDNYCSARCCDRSIFCRRCPGYDPETLVINSNNERYIDITTQTNIYVTSEETVIIYLPRRSHKLITIRILNGKHRILTTKGTRSNTGRGKVVSALGKCECIFISDMWHIIEFIGK